MAKHMICLIPLCYVRPKIRLILKVRIRFRKHSLDRFMLKINLGYPDASTEKQLLLNHQIGQPVDRLEAVTHMEHIATIQQEIRNIHINEVVVDYML